MNTHQIRKDTLEIDTFWPWELNNRWINNPQNKKTHGNPIRFSHASSTIGGLISPRLMKPHEKMCFYMWVDARLGGKANCNTCLLDRFVCSAGKCCGGKSKRIEAHLRVVGARLVARPLATRMLTQMCHGSNANNWWSMATCFFT